MTTLTSVLTADEIARIRADFPLLQQREHGYPLAYLDNSNTTQKPNTVLQAMEHYYRYDNANVHRSVYALSERATEDYEAARDKIQQLIHAEHRHEIIFVKGATEGINLIASSFARAHIKAGDEIIISVMEHHANIVPWQWVCEQYGATLRVIPIDDNGELDFAAYSDMLNARTRLVAITHVSNVLGTINPVQRIIARAHAEQVPVLLDGAQAVPHLPVDVQALDCDFYVFSGHKMYGPTGTGVVYGKTKWLEKMPPYQGGGSMIQQVSFAKTTYQKLPYKFEAGTPNIAGMIGLGAAVDYLQQLGLSRICAYEQQLLQEATAQLTTVPGLRIIGTATEKAAVISFVMADIHPHDIGTVLDSRGLAVRVGHHCAMPLMERYQVPATVRVSFAPYNTTEEITALIEALREAQRIFQVCPD